MRIFTTTLFACVSSLIACGSGNDESDDSAGVSGPGAILRSAGGDAAAPSGGGSTGSAGGTSTQSASKPQCKSFNLVNGTAGEKVNAALCFGLPDDVACAYNAVGNFTHCENSVYWYEADWSEQGGVTYGNIYGAAFPDMNGPTVAVVYQAEDGSFRYVNPNTEAEIMSCTVVGDVANKCVWP